MSQRRSVVLLRDEDRDEMLLRCKERGVGNLPTYPLGSRPKTSWFLPAETDIEFCLAGPGHLSGFHGHSRRRWANEQDRRIAAGNPGGCWPGSRRDPIVRAGSSHWVLLPDGWSTEEPLRNPCQRRRLRWRHKPTAAPSICHTREPWRREIL